LKKNEDKIPDEYLKLLINFDQYTIEGLIVYILGNLFHKIQVTKSPAVRVSTFFDKLNNFLINHGEMLRDRKRSQSKKEDNATNDHIQSTESPSLESCTNENSNNERSIVENDETISKKIKLSKVASKLLGEAAKDLKLIKGKYIIGKLLVEFLVKIEFLTLYIDLNFEIKYEVKKYKGKVFNPKSLYAVCNFEIDLLPIK